MKLLLDEQVPRRLATEFPSNYSVKTAQQMGWASERNGELLTLAAEHDFDALITADKNMEYQQNSESLPLTVIVMAPLFNRFSDLVPLVPTVVSILESSSAKNFYRVDA